MKLLGVNIDHIATLRNVRDAKTPDLMRAIDIIDKCMGIECITIHLREDRRHIKDIDAKLLCNESPLKINLEIACTEEMVDFAVQNKPYSVCFVPEKREEMTTESGLDVISHKNKIANAIVKLKEVGIKVSLFLDPVSEHIETAKEIGADAVEIHTGKYSNDVGIAQQNELIRIQDAAKLIATLGMECHAGHGLNYKNIVKLAKIEEISLFNIGHFLIGESLFLGLEKAINKMHEIINA